MIVFFTLTVPALLATPLPPDTAVLPAIVGLARFTVPPLLKMPPPLAAAAVLFAIVLLMTFRLPPLFKMAPPLAGLLLPLVMAMLRSVRLMPELMMNTRNVFPPLIVTAWPEPSMIVLAEIVRVALVRVMVPLHAKVTVPPPARAASKLASSHVLTVPP